MNPDMTPEQKIITIADALLLTLGYEI